ncbi:MAG: response regulator [Desulfovibrio sp.]|nr:response regulator [Desulfovibrio sp.]
MYSCTIRICLAGCPEPVVRVAEALAPLPGFSHEIFLEPVAGADVIIAGAAGEGTAPHWEAVLALGREHPSAGLIVLAPCGLAVPQAVLRRAADIWRLPMDEAELRFRFGRWQERFREGKDLWQARQFLDAVLETSPHMIWFKTRDGLHERVNTSFCRAAGKTKAQIEGRGHAAVWDVERDDPACVDSERIVMAEGGIHVSEEAISTGAGERLLTVYKSPLHNVDGSVMGTMGIAVDVTRERRYRERILQDNAALEALFTSMDCGILCHSLDGGRVISINRAALELLDFSSREDLQSHGFQMVASTVAEEDKDKLRAAIGQLKNAGDSTNYEYRVLHRDGRTVHIMGSARLVEKDGELVCQRFLLDCTAQKLAEEREQHEKERRQRRLVRALSADYQLVCVLDAGSDDGRVLQLAGAPDRRLGEIFAGDAPFMEKVETYVRTCVHPDDREALRQSCSPAALRAALAERETVYHNYRALNGGDILYFQLKAVRVGAPYEDFGVVVGLQSVDARTRREMEQKSQLAEALKQAKKASRAKSLFLSNMSHDIRTPMNAVVGYTSLALTHLGRRGQVEGYLQKILASGNHLISLINDILDMSYIESGKIELEEKPQELPVILREIWNIVQPTASAREQSLTLEVEGLRDESVLCDKLRLNQILLNLLSNSVKYTGRGGAIGMLVRQMPCAVPGRAAYEFHIRDNGIGMSEDFLARIFEPFERAQTSTVAGTEGTGLGMAITKNLVDMMGGDIEVTSALGVGTEFVFRVSFRLPEDAAEHGLPGGATARVLVAESDPADGARFLRMLPDRGVEAHLATTEAEALALLESPGGYDLCLVSSHFPGGAAELARRMAAAGGEARPFTALMRDNWAGVHPDMPDTPEEGVDAWLGKPVFWGDVRALLEAARAAGAVDAAHAVPRAPRPGRLLLAEDNAMNQEIAVEFLTDAGYTVDVAANGREAVEMLAAAPAGTYDVVLMDVQMPVLDGYGATQAIRALEDPRLASVPIIAMTANSFEEDKQEALRRGMNGHIAKPIDFNILFGTLARLLGQD